MPIRLRLTLWYGLLLGLTLLVFCVALYLGLQAALEGNFDQTLRVRATQVEREIATSQDDEDELEPAEISQDDLEPIALEDFAETGVYVQILSLRGEVLATSGTWLPVNEQLVTDAIAGTEGFDTLAVGSGQLLRSLYWPIRVRDNVIAIVQVAETLHFLEQTMHDARALMLGGASALLAAALGSGWLLTRRALSPVAEVTEAARHIATTGRFDRRLASTGPPDELGALAATFDVMIARVENIVTQQREFLADTSHELRNPLSVIRGNLDYVRRVTTDHACLEALREAEMEALRMSRLVNDLLLLAQADSAEFIAARPSRLDTLVHEVAEQARATADEHQIEVTGLSNVWVQADPDRVRQLLWNLVENALRYTLPHGRVSLSVRVADRYGMVDVADSGPGVAPEHEPRIFERFYRADRSRARATGGAGLGLAIVKRIAEAHGGSVTLTNRPGRGATFSVALPLSAEPLSSEPGSADAAQEGPDLETSEPAAPLTHSRH